VSTTSDRAPPARSPSKLRTVSLHGSDLDERIPTILSSQEAACKDTAATTAVEQAERFAAELHEEWLERHRLFRESRGLRPAPRAGSAVARLLDLLPAVPVMTARTVQRYLARSPGRSRPGGIASWPWRFPRTLVRAFLVADVVLDDCKWGSAAGGGKVGGGPEAAAPQVLADMRRVLLAQ
jgi:uncharacterized membrane protein YccC